MNNTIQISKTNIYLLPLTDKAAHFCQLKTLSNFLKYHLKTTLIKFSYVDAQGSTLGNLSLSENLNLNLDGEDLDNFLPQKIDQILNNLGNNYLTQLYKNLLEHDEASEELDQESIKIMALIKSFFRSGPFCIYHCPEKFLSSKNLELFKNALEYQTITTEKIVLIASNDENTWKPFSTHIIGQDKNRKYLIKPITKKRVTSEQQDNSGQLNFSNLEYKKVS